MSNCLLMLLSHILKLYIIIMNIIFVHLQKIGTTSPVQTASHLHGTYKYWDKTQALLQNLWILHACTLSLIPSQCSLAYSQAHNPGKYCIIGGTSRARKSKALNKQVRCIIIEKSKCRDV